jgi:hypothetical protein
LHRYFVNEIYPPLGNRRLVEVTALDIQQIVFRKRDNGFEAAAAQIRNLFKRLFDYAITLPARFGESCPRDPDAFYHSRPFSHPGTIAR